MSSELQFNENAVCDVCGRFGAYEFDGKRLCAECYESRGSCCLEFGGDDLWKDAEGSPRRKTQEPIRQARGGPIRQAQGGLEQGETSETKDSQADT
jgi:hypothetical protein